jgi:hypothetical protein
VYPLLPLSDTILLTSMPTIEHDLSASTAAVTATMSLYLLAAGVGFALWGPISGACVAGHHNCNTNFKQHSFQGAAAPHQVPDGHLASTLP